MPVRGLEQTVPVLHVPPEQQRWPLAPHAMQVPPVRMFEQTLPIAHAPPVQQFWPVAPHARQVPIWHVEPAEQVFPVQQGCPAPPQSDIWQTMLRQVRPPVHIDPPQQGCPAPPHATHTVPPTHWLPVLQVVRLQQA